MPELATVESYDGIARASSAQNLQPLCRLNLGVNPQLEAVVTVNMSLK